MTYREQITLEYRSMTMPFGEDSKVRIYTITIFFADGNQRCEWGTPGLLTTWAARYRVSLTWDADGAHVTEAPSGVTSVVLVTDHKTHTDYPGRVLCTNLGDIRTNTVNWVE